MSYLKKYFSTAMMEICGVILFAIGIHVFVAYNNIVPGGVTGIATIINYLIKIPIGVTSFFINVPLLMAGFLCLGKKTVARTILTVFELSFMIDVGVAWLPVYHGNILAASLMGGVCMGCGLSLILKSRTTTGGGDLLGKIVQKKHPNVSMGKILLTIDCSVISVSAIVYGQIKYALCGVLTMAVATLILDHIYQPKIKVEMA